MRKGITIEVSPADRARIGLAEHQFVEGNVARGAEGDLLDGGCHVDILRDGRPKASLSTSNPSWNRPPSSRSRAETVAGGRGPARTSPGGPQFRLRRFPALLIAVAAPAAASPALLHPRQVDQRAGRALVGRHRRSAAKVHHAISNSSAACIVSTGSEGAGRKASR
jgi:hypothetical protein